MVRNMNDSGAEETLNQFVIELYLQTQGDPSNIASWYDIGETLGLDREGSLQAAEEIGPEIGCHPKRGKQHGVYVRDDP